ncbi:DUF2637 domain-containing protein [Micromonospora sp. NPDC048830]|uniref:DUF2637 domain-containing protein n=1 Tax=Micromonospora sp. NPDC048830 TaxID=3364257 RepID=UPI0037131361
MAAHPAATSGSPAGAPITGNRTGDKQLRRLRWAVRATLVFGVAASVAANVLHARPNPISQIIAAWPPLALLLTVELISRVPHHRWYLGAIRVTAAAVIAVIAAWVSYWHLVGVAARYGETSYGAAYLLPISVDGLVIVASVSLVEISARIRVTSTQAVPTAATERPTAPAAVALDPLTPAFEHVPQSSAPADEAAVAQRPPTDAERTAALATPACTSLTVPHAAAPPMPPGPGADDRAATPRLDTEQRTTAPVTAPAADNTSRDHDSAPSAVALTEDAGPDSEAATLPPTDTEPQSAHVADTGVASTAPDPAAPSSPAGSVSGHDRRELSGGAVALADTAAAVAYWRHRDPALRPADIAARIGRSERTVRRHWQPRGATRTARVNGHPASKLRR